MEHPTTLEELYDICGQSPWIDNLSREWLNSGEISRLIESGIRGLTSNPTIFAKAITGSEAYDEQFADLLKGGATSDSAYWTMVCDDLKRACDLLHPIWEESKGADGFASLEVAPSVAFDTAKTIEMAKELWARVDKPNLMIKIPATDEGLPAIEEAIASGINVNVTLIFTDTRYTKVWAAFTAGYTRYMAANPKPSRWPHAVASFFLSRIDALVEKKLDDPQFVVTYGSLAVAQAKTAYQGFLRAVASDTWAALQSEGANPPRLLWASVTPKSKAVVDTYYVDELIGPYTVSTIPEVTVKAFLDHGTIKSTLEEEDDGDTKLNAKLHELGIDAEEIGKELEADGAKSFGASFDEVMTSLDAKAAALK